MGCCNCCCKKKNVTVAELNNGKLVEYDLCHSEYKDYGCRFSYIGAGVVYSVNGAYQNGSKSVKHFWVKL